MLCVNKFIYKKNAKINQYPYVKNFFFIESSKMKNFDYK